MIAGYLMTEIALFFLVYSVIGWVTEVIYQAVSKGIVVNRGFLNGPVCPIYGFGSLFVILLDWTIVHLLQMHRYSSLVCCYPQC